MSSDIRKKNVEQFIDENLKRVYDTVLAEDVPDRFADLLQQLEAGERAEAGDASDREQGEG